MTDQEAIQHLFAVGLVTEAVRDDVLLRVKNGANADLYLGHLLASGKVSGQAVLEYLRLTVPAPPPPYRSTYVAS